LELFRLLGKRERHPGVCDENTYPSVHDPLHVIRLETSTLRNFVQR
jgi:methyl coenzyme M reductase gamma subunit